MKKLSKYLNYLICSMLLSYGLFYIYQARFAISQEEGNTLGAANQKIDVDSIVNKFIKETAAQIIHEQYASQVALKKQLVRPLNLIQAETKTEMHPDDIPAERQIRREDRSESPAEVVRKELYEKELQSKIEQQDRLEYARQYIENARRGGYHLVLSDDLKVISVTPIRKPSQTDDSVDAFPAD